MLLSMTGFGEAHRQGDGLAVAVEVRTINSRYFKLSLRCGEGYGTARTAKSRPWSASRSAGERCRSPSASTAARSAEDYRLNPDVLDSYRRQLSDRCSRQWQSARPTCRWRACCCCPAWSTKTPRTPAIADDDWPVVRRDARGGPGEPGPDASRRRPGHGASTCGPIARRGGQSGRDRRSGPRSWSEGYRSGSPSGCSRSWPSTKSRSDPADLITRGQPVRRAQRHLRGDRPAAQPPGAVRRRSWTARKLGPQAGVPHPGDVPRDEHDRLEGQRRRDRPARDRNQDGDRADPRDDPEHRVSQNNE